MSSRLHELLAFVAEHPGASGLAISDNGLEWGELPGLLRDEIEPYVDSLDPASRSTLALVHPDDHPAVMLAFAACWRDGYSECNVRRPADDFPTALLLWDLRTDVGSVIAVIVPDLMVASAPDGLDSLRPRTLTHTSTNDGRTITIDPETHRLLGWVDDEIFDRPRVDFLHPDDKPDAIAAWVKMLERPGASVRHRCRYRHRDNDRWVWFEITMTNRLDTHGHVHSEMLDITESMVAVEALHKREQLLRHLTEAMPLGIVHLSSDGEVLFANEFLSTIAGRAAHPHDLLQQVVDDDRNALRHAFDKALDGINSDIELWIMRPDGEECRCYCRVRSLGDREAGVLMSFEDITDRWNVTNHLERLAATDPLTGLLNRRATLDLVVQVQNDAQATGATTAVAFLDLNGFKQINDEQGHHIGDQVLATITARMADTLGPNQHLGRLGGDEFLVICPETNSQRAEQLTDRLRAAVAAQVTIDGHVIRCQTSCGLVLDPGGTMSVEAIVAAADAEMYRDKTSVGAS